MSSNYPGLTPLQPMPDALGSAQDSVDLLSHINEISGGEPMSVTYSSDGKSEPKVNVSMAPQMLQQAQDAILFKQKALQGYADQLQMREMQARQNPWATLATTLAGNLAANDKNMPGWVRGAGATALQLNPTPDTLAQQRMKVLEQIAGGNTQAASLAMEQARLNETANYHKATLEGKGEDREQKDEKNRLNAVRLISKPGEVIPRESFDAIAETIGAKTPAEKDQLYEAHLGVAGAVKGGLEAAQQRKTDLMAKQFGLTMSRDAQQHAYKVEDAETKFRNDMAKARTQNDYALARLNYSKELSDQFAANKALKVFDNKDIQRLQQTRATDLYLDEVQDMIKDPAFRDVSGPLIKPTYDKAGNVVDIKVNPNAIAPEILKGPDRRKYENLLQHEIPRLVNLIQNGQSGGIRIVQTKEGQELIRKLGTTSSDLPEYVEQVIGNIRDQNNGMRLSILESRPRAKQQASELADVLGVTNPNNAYFWEKHQDSFGHPLAIPPNAPAPTAPQQRTAPTPAGAKVLSWKDFQ